ncbi:glycosyltransferase involved in cell wall biosynthesis [Wenyingzhuangia heitensis]|uniref:Glycosyltransferase involved in cell wall biosynthesis n=1 Tax=Wenyingzhuangia heitensis TaxID=1487859 RepID=A0ABX0UD21_9FLAO|nr:glycosyltransferase [Wenyingzhuangia heitensis]NIJ45770.1 glycosyltransferase involved in cell wall biosynthesis [Wenyingzhuangia heitensis]
MTKIAIVIQRYGDEINGGAETHARLLAKKLSIDYEITILTTKAVDHSNWKDYYSEDLEYIDNIKTKRFSCTSSKPDKKFRKYRRIILKRTKFQQLLSKVGLYSFFNKRKYFEATEKENDLWLKSVGPNSPELVEYIYTNKDQYDCFIFFTYLYYTTVEGLKIVGNKSIYVPTAHDEPEFYASVYNSTYKNAKFIMYNTSFEKKLIEANHKIAKTKRNNIAGIGLEQVNYNQQPEHNYSFKYLLYIGRIEGGKGCFELYDFFNKFKVSNPNLKLKLIFVGKKNPKLLPNNDIIFTGFVSNNVKQHLLLNCEALIIPSYYESLSMVTLEAMFEKKIVIANGNCEVLKNHITNSDSGFYYHNENEFYNTINKLMSLSEHELKQHGEKARKYVKQNYTWPHIIEKFDSAIKFIKNS